jgi:hypothetical protein
MGGACSTYGRCAYRVFVKKPEERRPVGKLRRRRENNIKMDLREFELGGGRV